MDFFHMRQAWETIDSWFNGKSDEQKKHFQETLLSRVKFIWYETDAKDPIQVFTRLNIGKIPLTDAELVKALFLNKSNFAGTANETTIHLQQFEIAAEWDRIEYALQDDEFWLFISNDINWNKTKPTHIDFILDLIRERDAFNMKKDLMKKYGLKEADWRKCLGSDEHQTFRYFYEHFKIHKDNIRNNLDGFKLRDDIWGEIKKYFQIFKEWFNDLEMYHYIGFLIDRGVSVENILVEWSKPPDIPYDKACFKKYLMESIRKKQLIPNMEKPN